MADPPPVRRPASLQPGGPPPIVRRSTVNLPTPQNKSGWLNKKGKPGLFDKISWQKRWFELEGLTGQFSYYVDAKEKTEIGTIEIRYADLIQVTL